MLHATVFHDGTEGTVTLQQSVIVIIEDFLIWNPLLLPNWIWIIVTIVVAIALAYIFFKSA